MKTVAYLIYTSVNEESGATNDHTPSSTCVRSSMSPSRSFSNTSRPSIAYAKRLY